MICPAYPGMRGLSLIATLITMESILQEIGDRWFALEYDVHDISPGPLSLEVDNVPTVRTDGMKDISTLLILVVGLSL